MLAMKHGFRMDRSPGILRTSQMTDNFAKVIGKIERIWLVYMNCSMLEFKCSEEHYPHLVVGTDLFSIKLVHVSTQTSVHSPFSDYRLG